MIFIISGLIELYSTSYLLNLEDKQVSRQKAQEEALDLDWIRYITLIYTIESFGLALIVNRMLIYIHEVQVVEWLKPIR